jgi:hypothetical protein
MLNVNMLNVVMLNVVALIMPGCQTIDSNHGTGSTQFTESKINFISKNKEFQQNFKQPIFNQALSPTRWQHQSQV